MFFVASKLLGIVFQPINFLILVGLMGVALMRSRLASFGRWIANAALIVLALIAFLPVGALLLRPLEDRFPPPPGDMAAPNGIIVLGGAMDADVTAARRQPKLTDAAARLTAGVDLARRFPSARLIFTGGSADITQSGLDEASAVRALWLSLGVPPERMTFEAQSRNTFENATRTRAIISPRPSDRWLLVTSAAHMPRAVGIFRQDGWSIVPFPVDYRTYGDWRDFKPTSTAIDSLRKIDVAWHEWTGLLAYRLSGKTDALFPGP